MSLLGRLIKNRFSHGTLRLRHPHGQEELLEGAEGRFPEVAIRVNDPYLLLKLCKSPNLGFGEAFMNGGFIIESGSLHDLLSLCTQKNLSSTPTSLAKAWDRLLRLSRLAQSHNTLTRSLRNVSHHYDLTEEFYSLFLDPDKQYSCAYFSEETDPLHEAQRQKKDHIAAKMDLKPGQKILDIGCGWGGMALYLAQQEDVEVTGLTLSKEQLKVAVRRAKELNLQKRVKFHLRDYRSETEKYDRIVSVGMFEHVGPTQYPTFFHAVKERLLPTGRALLHSIGSGFGPSSPCPWVQKYIFPGGYCPGLSEVLACVEDKKLFVHDIEVLHDHYPLTLQAWRRRFTQAYEQVSKIYDERFCKMWEYYLTCSEVAFQHQGFMVFQILLHKDRSTVPLTRNAHYEQEMRYHTATVA